eukprot:2175081-Amphidinium_carterae.1
MAVLIAMVSRCKDNRISAELAARVSRYIDLAVDMHKKRTDRSQVAQTKRRKDLTPHFYCTPRVWVHCSCLLYTSDAADDTPC